MIGKTEETFTAENIANHPRPRDQFFTAMLSAEVKLQESMRSDAVIKESSVRHRAVMQTVIQAPLKSCRLGLRQDITATPYGRQGDTYPN